MLLARSRNASERPLGRHTPGVTAVAQVVASRTPAARRKH
ncbi:PmrA [Streptomyces sp. 8K308]|nr:PmrA [Streptomyces sp. 8K308]